VICNLIFSFNCAFLYMTIWFLHLQLDVVFVIRAVLKWMCWFWFICLSVCRCTLWCSRHPEVKWAQRVDKVYITVQLADSKNSKVDLTPEGDFTFSGSAGAGDNQYELKLELFDKVNVEVRLCPKMKDGPYECLPEWVE
jgi:hypothetical protein